MKVIPDKSCKNQLIWLTLFVLLLSPGPRDSGTRQAYPLRDLKQTELTLTARDQRSEKKFHTACTGAPKQTSGITGDLFFHSRITRHSNVAALKWKMSQKHVLFPSLKFVLVNTAQKDDEDLSLLKG